MNQLRRLVGLLSIVGLPVSLVCLVRADMGRFNMEQFLIVPLLAVALASFALAVGIDVKIGKSEKVVPLFESGVGMYHAWLRAPILVVICSGIGILVAVMFGSAGKLSHWPESPAEAQIAFATTAGFLAVSLPSIYTNHPAVDP